MISDSHLHTVFSYDGKSQPEEMIEQAIRMGMDNLCITDHMDMDFPGDAFWLDTPAYIQRLTELREKYKDRIRLRIGVELGLQKHITGIMERYVKRYPFDFVLGSVHLIQGKDPYEREQFSELSDKELYRLYFQDMHRNLQVFSGFDSLGHLDYVVRYGKYQAEEYSYRMFADEIDAILKLLVESGRGLEVNTGGLAYGLGFPNPHPDILKRYRELGGEIVTVGSDAHDPQRLGWEFKTARDLLLECGFSAYTEFDGRKPVFHIL